MYHWVDRFLRSVKAKQEERKLGAAQTSVSGDHSICFNAVAGSSRAEEVNARSQGVGDE